MSTLQGNSSVVSSPNPILTEVTMPGRAKLIITKELQDQINFLHNRVGKKEWSGFLFYEILEGDFNDPANLVIRVDDIFLMDIGTSAHTAARITSEDTMTMYETIPGAEDGKKYGLIHTHRVGVAA